MDGILRWVNPCIFDAMAAQLILFDQDPTIILLRHILTTHYRSKFKEDFRPSDTNNTAINYKDSLCGLTWNHVSDTRAVVSMNDVLISYMREEPCSEGEVEKWIGGMLSGFFSTEYTIKLR